MLTKVVDKEKILAGRKAVDTYREAHRQLHSKPWHRGIPAEHTPLLNTLVKELNNIGFNTIQEFFDASNEVNEATAKLYRREGECNRCGKCCEGCEYYKGGGVCAIYETRPQVCVEFPTTIDYLGFAIPAECSYTFVPTEPLTDIEERWV